jgi:hypothetical protein
MTTDPNSIWSCKEHIDKRRHHRKSGNRSGAEVQRTVWRRKGKEVETSTTSERTKVLSYMFVLCLTHKPCVWISGGVGPSNSPDSARLQDNTTIPCGTSSLGTFWSPLSDDNGPYTDGGSGPGADQIIRRCISQFLNVMMCSDYVPASKSPLSHWQDLRRSFCPFFLIRCERSNKSHEAVRITATAALPHHVPVA